LQSFRVRNAPKARDYFSADQVYLMLGHDATLKEMLINFLSDGWDEESKNLLISNKLDVDSVGILHLIKSVSFYFLHPNHQKEN
jgi:hypothetical protein